MYLLFFLFGLLILNKNLDALNEKFCVNCQHFISVPGCNNKVGRCRLFPKKTDNFEEWNYLVSGKRNVEYRFCNFVREDPELCGISGKYYTQKIFPFPKIPKLSEIKSKLKSKLCIPNYKKEIQIQNSTSLNDNTNINESIPISNNTIDIDYES
jgi:hypothetical protein